MRGHVNPGSTVVKHFVARGYQTFVHLAASCLVKVLQRNGVQVFVGAFQGVIELGFFRKKNVGAGVLFLELRQRLYVVVVQVRAVDWKRAAAAAPPPSQGVKSVFTANLFAWYSMCLKIELKALPLPFLSTCFFMFLH